MSASVRVRFPPSPTGMLHVGSARTALFNWLYARHHGGALVLRFEDTDRARSTDAAIEQALRVLHWLGIDWDEGPFRQTDRYHLYQQCAERLIAEGKAYRCYCTTAELEAERERRVAAGLPLIYGGRCRTLAAAERERLEAEGRPFAVRLVVDEHGTTAIEDVIHGRVEWENALVGDHIVLRSDGAPTYQFANPFDDIDQGVTHVIRGEDLLSSTPRQLALYRALGAPPPVYAHLPMVLGTDKKRLSKRHGAVSVEEFRDRGIVPEAMRNYLALVGWSYDASTTFMTTAELVERFTLERVNRSPGVFDPEKLSWLNGEHLRAMTPDQFAEALLEYLRLVRSPLADAPERVAAAAPLVQEKLRELSQFGGLAGFLFGPVSMRPEAWERVAGSPDAARALDAGWEALEAVGEWTAESVERALRSACERTGMKPRQLFAPVRVAISGSTVSPGLFESLELLGREESLSRLADARARLARGDAA
jgi:glutamyl-tRNA synthetase